MDFGEDAVEEEPQGPKLVNKRLSSGCDRFVGVTCQNNKTNKKQQKKILSAPRYSERKKKQKGMGNTYYGLHPDLRRGTTKAWWYHDVSGPPTTRCIVRMIDNSMWLHGERS